ncbi:MAG: hypothetical protein AABW83_03085 [Nanoarchaeota archaeon]
MTLSRRELLIHSGISIIGGIVGASLLDSIKNINHNDNPLHFEVNIFSDKEKAKNKLPEKIKHLADKSEYMRITPHMKHFSDKLDLYKNYSEMYKDANEDYFTNRIVGKEKFSLVLISPSIGGTKEYTADYSFLDNDSILEVITLGVFGYTIHSKKIWEEYNKKISYFNFEYRDPNRDIYISYKNIDITLPPKNAGFMIEGESILYKIKGLEALTDNDPEKLKREWNLKTALLLSKK